jgi:hypothetical protein
MAEHIIDPTTDKEYSSLDAQIQEQQKALTDLPNEIKRKRSAGYVWAPDRNSWIIPQFNKDPHAHIGDQEAVKYANTAPDPTSYKKAITELTAKRDNRAAVLKQTGANMGVGDAGAEAVANENLLSQNINQEITGRIARNTAQADEAQKAVNILTGAKLGQNAVKAGRAGYDASSGTAGVLAQSATAKTEADKAAIESYRIANQNLLMGQGDAATKAAESLTGTVSATTADWASKSMSAVNDVTGARLKNVETVLAVPGNTGDVNTPGVKASVDAIGTTLGTWSLQSYMDVLNTLTSHSTNKSTWDQMLLDQASPAVNPYSSYEAAISPLTPVAGTASNLLAAAAGGPDLSNVYTLSGNKNKTGGLI